MIRICATGVALPPFLLDDAAFGAALEQAFAPHFSDVRPLLRMAARCGVRERYLVRPVAETLTPVSLTERSRIYRDWCRTLGANAALAALDAAGMAPEAIDIVVTCSCTGYLLPSLDAYLVGELGLRRDVCRLPITELGCAAGAAALARAANLLSAGPYRNALVVAVEVPSLTFQPGDGSMDNVVSALVFADGAGAAVLRADNGPGFELLDSRSVLVPHTLDEMGFELRESGFHVVLTRDVPELLAPPFAAAANDLLSAHGLTAAQLGFACIHPGGPKILRGVDGILGVEGLTAPSWEVLAKFGNQSSAAVFFVLDRLMAEGVPDGAFGLLAGFGPGLSIELSLLRRSA